MKRIWIAIAFLTLSIGICITEQVYIHTTYNEICEYIDKKDTDGLYNYWSEKNDTLYAFADHKILDSLSDSINTLKDTNEKEKALIEIKAKAKTYYENQRITFSNIF